MVGSQKLNHPFSQLIPLLGYQYFKLNFYNYIHRSIGYKMARFVHGESSMATGLQQLESSP
ncbi:Hypothetical protein I595_590 [Croceitalea dokdonensis DOKDO 023]|uniref:Uncharacterized protein n=1 Tax=Croceitalea dokdonensis DOKDO 023 TaxID=1300341 RepID=A0A0N8H4L2_9FLAO|nr:Hypothetical protein I595_590 [Croceitalea dokdonensis DOKDO 023]